MNEDGLTAIVADTTESGNERIRDMLLSLEINTLAITNDGAQTFSLTSAMEPDFLIINPVLAHLDGIAVAERLAGYPLRVRPGVIMLTWPSFVLMPGHRALLQENGVVCLEKPFDGAQLEKCLNRVRPEVRRLPERIETRINQLMQELGFPDHPGTVYLQDAIGFTYMDARLAQSLTRKLYPMVAARHESDAGRVERAMRHAIDIAWKTGAIDVQYALFGATIDAQRGKPTCGALIAQLADILRLEETSK